MLFISIKSVKLKSSVPKRKFKLVLKFHEDLVGVCIGSFSQNHGTTDLLTGLAVDMSQSGLQYKSNEFFLNIEFVQETPGGEISFGRAFQGKSSVKPTLYNGAPLSFLVNKAELTLFEFKSNKVCGSITASLYFGQDHHRIIIEPSVVFKTIPVSMLKKDPSSKSFLNLWEIEARLSNWISPEEIQAIFTGLAKQNGWRPPIVDTSTIGLYHETQVDIIPANFDTRDMIAFSTDDESIHTNDAFSLTQDDTTEDIVEEFVDFALKSRLSYESNVDISIPPRNSRNTPTESESGLDEELFSIMGTQRNISLLDSPTIDTHKSPFSLSPRTPRSKYSTHRPALRGNRTSPMVPPLKTPPSSKPAKIKLSPSLEDMAEVLTAMDLESDSGSEDIRQFHSHYG